MPRSLGQDGRRDLGGQDEQGAAAALPRADPDGVEPLGEASSVSALPGRCRGNSQGKGCRAGCAGLASGRGPGDEVVQQSGQRDRAAAQAQDGAAVFMQDVLGCPRRPDAERMAVTPVLAPASSTA